MAGPMEGVRVVEIGVWVAGPAAGAVLADWGADVVKIEPLGVGDPSRLFQSMLGADMPVNPIFENDNRNKRSIAMDLASEEGHRLALELVDAADVLITNVRQSGLARLGLDAPTLLERNPRLIYGAISGFGFAGPDADKAAYDIAGFWARSGIADALTAPSAPHPPFQRGGMGDHTAGQSLAGGVAAALFKRERSGRGQLVTTSLLRQGLYTLSFDLSVALRLGVAIASADRDSMGNPTINCYRDARDRWFWIVGLEADRHWPPLCRVVDHPEWIDDPRFADAQGRAIHATEIIAELDAVFASRSREDWATRFEAEPDMWWAPVQTALEALADPQVEAAGGIVEVPDGPSTSRLPATPVDFGSTPAEQRWMAPEHGQHGEEILRELGHDEGHIAQLRSRGILA